MDKWISVEDHIPECIHEYTRDSIHVSNSVLVTDCKDPCSLGMAHLRQDGIWEVYGGDHDFMHPGQITHWQPFPSPPTTP